MTAGSDPASRREEHERFINETLEFLLAEGLIVDSGQRRNGQIVYVAPQYAKKANPQ